MGTPLNYATQYSTELANAYPYVLHFGRLYATPNNGRYRFLNARTIEIPRISTTGRVDADRDTIAMATRNYDNTWEPKSLTHQRKWSTLVHPADIDQTNAVTSITNITRTFNEQQKFPEMDAYCVSTLYTLWSTTDAKDSEKKAMTPDKTALTAENILDVFDTLMENMDEANVPPDGRILYVTSKIRKLLKKAEGLVRHIDVKSGNSATVNRDVSRLDEVEIVTVPSALMKTKYKFDKGWQVDESAAQINMFLVHPSAVITPVSYENVQLDEPSGVTEGKYIYFEESYEDVFILNKMQDALQFNVTESSP